MEQQVTMLPAAYLVYPTSHLEIEVLEGVLPCHPAIIMAKEARRLTSATLDDLALGEKVAMPILLVLAIPLGMYIYKTPT